MSQLLSLSKFRRLLVIVWVLSRYRLDQLIQAQALPLPARILLMIGPWQLFKAPKLSRGERLHQALESLGPIFIKFGQILSTRRDILPDDIADELQKLQDKVPPFEGTKAEAIITNALGAKPQELFAHYNTTPLASASIAQVHEATLRNGKEVVVKVIRPNILGTIKQDIALLKLMATLLENFWEDGKRLHPLEVVEDYERTIHDELDLQREAANASQLRRNFLDSELIYIPEIYWDYTHKDVLVMERISGIPVADIETLKANNTNLKRLAERGVEIFFTQVFRDSFFHADMHPGNIFVSEQSPQTPQYIAVDFGIVGTLSPEDQNYLARNLLAFFKRDYRLVAELHVSSGWVPEDTRVDEFESAIRTVCEPIFERPLSEISFAQFLLRLFQTARRFNMEVQPQLVLLQKTLLNIEGLGRQLYPDLDLWSTAQPFLENWMHERMAPPGVFKNVKERLPEWLEQSPEVPRLVFDAMTQITQLDKRNQDQRTLLESTLRQQQAQQRQSKRQGLAIALVASGAVLANDAALAWVTSLSWSSGILIAAGALLWWRR